MEMARAERQTNPISGKKPPKFLAHNHTVSGRPQNGIDVLAV
jgi:hypothetical protein